MLNTLSNQAIREIRQLYKDVSAIKRRLNITGGTGPREQQQLYAQIVGYDQSNLGYDATEVLFGGEPDNWVAVEDGRIWGDESNEIGMLYAIDSTKTTYEGVHPVFRFSDGSESFWGFIPQDSPDDFWKPFKHSIDGTSLRFNDGTIFFNDRVSDVVTDGTGFPLSQDGYYYVEWEMNAGTYSHTTNAEVQYSDTEPSFWDDSGDGTAIVKWKIAEVWAGDVFQEWDGNINGPGSGMASFDLMSDGSGDPSVGLYAGIYDASQSSDRIDHDYFLTIVKSVDKYVQGVQYSHTEDGSVQFGGLSDSSLIDYLDDVDGGTTDRLYFKWNTKDPTYKAGLLQDDDIQQATYSFYINALKWIGIDSGTEEVDIVHRQSPVSSEGDDEHWTTLDWDGTDWSQDGTVLGALSISVDENGHIWAINDDPPPPPDINFRYAPCDGGAAIILDTKPADVLGIGSICYLFDGTTVKDPDTLSWDATFANCIDCDASGDNELWLACADDATVAVLTPSHTDVDYAWLCDGGTYKKCYNSTTTFAAATNPTVLKQTGITPTVCAHLTGFNVAYVVIGNFDFDDGESFYTAPGNQGNLKSYNSSNETSNSINWDGFGDSLLVSRPLKMTIGGVEYTFGGSVTFSDIDYNVGYNSSFNASRYFVASGLILSQGSGSITNVSFPISSFTGNVFPTYSGSFSVRIYKEEITNGTDLTLLTPVQTGTLTISPTDKGTWKAVSLSSGSVSNYSTVTWDPTGTACT